MKPTKRPKHVIVFWVDQIVYVSNYICPCCKTEFVNHVSKNTSRFYCSCGQELIISPPIA